MMRATITLALVFVSAVAFGHSAPNSVVRLDFRKHSVHAEVMIPESELAFATAAERRATRAAEVCGVGASGVSGDRAGASDAAV